MAYKIVATDEMVRLLDQILEYMTNHFHNPQAARNLLNGIQKIYAKLEINPRLYRESLDPFMHAFHYREAKIPGMEYILIYKISGEFVYIVGIFHSLEDYPRKIEVIWNGKPEKK